LGGRQSNADEDQAELGKFADPVVGTLAKSQKKNLDEMKDWGDNPFVEYRVKPVRGYFVFEKKHKLLHVGVARRGAILNACIKCAKSAASSS